MLSMETTVVGRHQAVVSASGRSQSRPKSIGLVRTADENIVKSL
jgi:hypothetical protein